MLVPRSYVYSSSPPKDLFNEKNGRRNVPKSSVPAKTERNPSLRTTSPARTTTEPVQMPSKPVAVPAPTTPARAQSAEARSMPTRKTTGPNGSRRKPSAHDPNALPPAIAALLAVTAIPRPKPNQFRRPRSHPRRISIDELVNEWKTDESLDSSYSSSPALSALLEDGYEAEEPPPLGKGSLVDDGFLHTRSTSAESIPSLEADDRSVLSLGSASTPGSLRSQKSSSNLKRDKARSLPTAEECPLDHPLVPPPIDEDPDEGLILSPSTSRASTPKPKPSFKSNLTTSLQVLKNAAINSISSFTLSSASSQAQRTPSAPMSDDMLWSHPFLFPRFSPEVRPSIQGTPTKAQRRYLNPVPLTFEEQEAPYQQALHAPYLAARTEDAPTIQMQTYSRGRRRSANKRSGPDAQSEAGRALIAASGVRQREPRENSDFLRVVVLEMNMRREGKLETGRAKIWLPPRQVSPVSEERAKVPKRWVGESAY